MRALTVIPMQQNSLAVLDVPDPEPADGELLVDGLAVGVCGTDKEIALGGYGWAPPGRQRLVMGHESLGRVRRAQPERGFSTGDLVVGVVRRPDPVPCGACARGQFDMCRNGRYTERGIKSLDGYASQQWRIEADYAVKLDPALAEVGMLLEPTSVVAKAWDEIDKVGARAWFQPRTALVTGAGPVMFAALANTGPYGIVCLTGVSSGGHRLSLDASSLNREIVLENDAMIGSVNANFGHYAAAADALATADHAWLGRLITRRVPLERAPEAFTGTDADVKVVIALDGTGS